MVKIGNLPACLNSSGEQCTGGASTPEVCLGEALRGRLLAIERVVAFLSTRSPIVTSVTPALLTAPHLNSPLR